MIFRRKDTFAASFAVFLETFAHLFFQMLTLQLKGKILFGMLGAAIGGFIFASFGGLAVCGFLALVLGHYLFDKPREKTFEKEYSAYLDRKKQFVFHVFALCAKIAKADGNVSAAEIKVMKRLLRDQFKLPEKQHEALFDIWRKSKDASKTFEEMANTFFHEFSQDRNRVLDMMHLLFEVAAADGGLHPREEQMLLRAAGIFHIGRMQFERIKSRFFQMPAEEKWQPSDPLFAILGAQASDSLEIIKKKYRELAKKWHPDRVTASGGSPEVVKHAKEKFQQINEAYEKILILKKG